MENTETPTQNCVKTKSDRSRSQALGFMVNVAFYQTVSTGYLYRFYTELNDSVIGANSGQQAGLAFTIITLIILFAFFQYVFHAPRVCMKVEMLMVLISLIFTVIQNGLLTQFYYIEIVSTRAWQMGSFHYVFLWLMVLFQILSLLSYAGAI